MALPAFYFSECRKTPAEIRADAEKLFKSGQLNCSEAVMKSLRDAFCPDIPDYVIAMTSGFPVGMGGAGCTCGAVAGGVCFLGLIFGRSRTEDVLKTGHTMKLAHELHDKFRSEHTAVCCRLLTNKLVIGSAEHARQCTAFTGEVAETVAEIILREAAREIKDETSELTSQSKVTEILSVYPQAAEVFMNYGMTCLASVIARDETLAVAVTHKNLPLDKICADLGIRMI